MQLKTLTRAAINTRHSDAVKKLEDIAFTPHRLTEKRCHVQKAQEHMPGSCLFQNQELRDFISDPLGPSACPATANSRPT